ncbi:MAG: hypothetical protein QM619_13765 [Micropruina sp.]|uniref:hypothetical protein n=1 Tax=Micropruina sp. TaxID=2737536 RepID=UPI0039E21D95
MPEIREIVDSVADRRTPPQKPQPASMSMTVLAQDPAVVADGQPIAVPIPIPRTRLQCGPANHRFHVVDVSARGLSAKDPVQLHPHGEPWEYVDPWADAGGTLPREVVMSPRFQAQNVFAIATHTLALFERNLGRRVPWRSGWPHIFLVPRGMLAANAAYTPDKRAVIFGWLPAVGELPSVYTCLSYDVIAHEVTHAILDGLRPRYVEPGLPDQLAFHEALADVVALLSVFELKGVVERLLGASVAARIIFPSDRAAASAAERMDGRAAQLKGTALLGLAEELGRARALRDRIPLADAEKSALRRSVDLDPDPGLLDAEEFQEAHRRAEVLVAAVMQTLAGMWASRIDELDDREGLSAARVAEEGVRAAKHLLGMVVRAIDYLPPIELEFADVIDSIVTADNRLNPDDEFDYRGTLLRAFAAFGITPPTHRILDEDGVAAPRAGAEDLDDGLDDPDAPPDRIRYDRLNFAALRTSPEEVFAFIWNNASALGIDVRLATRVDRVLSSTRVGEDGLIVNEILADYTQSIVTTADRLPAGMTRPDGMDPGASVTLWGGGVLIFDQFGRFRLHQRKPILDTDRQQRRLEILFARDIKAQRGGGFGSSDGVNADDRFAVLHARRSADSW